MKTSIKEQQKTMKNYIYLVIFDWAIDDFQEQDIDIRAYSTFEKAYKEFDSLKFTAINDYNELFDKEDIEIDESDINDTYIFSIYEEGFYSRNHNTITLVKKELL